MSPNQQAFELRLTQVSLTVTVVAAAMLAWSVGTVTWTAIEQRQLGRAIEAVIFAAIAGYLVYGNLCYELARLGRLTRGCRDGEASADPPPDAFSENIAPALTILVPSYKEEIPVVRQTLLSAALQDYPNKRVVLLLDDPPSPKTHSDRTALWSARSVPFDLQTSMARPAECIARARREFRNRSSSESCWGTECVRLSDAFLHAAEWFEDQAKQYPIQSHTDVWFVREVLTVPGEEMRRSAGQWFGRRRDRSGVVPEEIAAEMDAVYERLSGRFLVEFDVFERKQYCNLSHEPNKAMNLNSYLGVMGKRVKPVLRADGVLLDETRTTIGSRVIPDSPYVITLDADSLLKPNYARTLVSIMEQPDQARMAVAQTPYSAFPNAPGALERTAGATTDIQYFVHQGFTRFAATFWVGANALLRKSALEDICQIEQTGRITVRRYIQDRTVIEDTESTVDLMAKGWTLYNYPDRLAYSATPPDFGSLVIQRARWANGGLIILPKLLEFLWRTRKRPATVPQALLQVHYLTSLALTPLSVVLLLSIPFSSDLMTPAMPLASLPYFILYARDLALAGYRPIRDLGRAYALNLLLIPVHLAGAVTSLRQMAAGTKIPFRRTPKVSGRTRTSGLDLGLQLSMILLSAGLALYHGSEGRWISASFALANLALLCYGVGQFIGLTEACQDLALSARETLARYVKPGRFSDRLLAPLSSSTALCVALVQPMRRTRPFSRQALWSLTAFFDMIVTIVG
ncbi:Glycosyltransferase family group 2 [Nitrospira japonica]|uniref:Glycosyltransferase family group 2 n=1 Tax=Nitrospira japonica TaxID=1325564 RepID=A0A1W1I0K2_9BACT|nr:glycosyltransferase family 2 protein [Nitrospira japonica]SLM46512.1 Glycosyltransferase family group 2 [Nitrospira japonica]